MSRKKQINEWQEVLLKNIAVLAAANGLKEIDVSRAVGLTPSTYSERRNGNTQFKVNELLLLAELFRVTPDVLFSKNLLSTETKE